MSRYVCSKSSLNLNSNSNSNSEFTGAFEEGSFSFAAFSCSLAFCVCSFPLPTPESMKPLQRRDSTVVVFSRQIYCRQVTGEELHYNMVVVDLMEKCWSWKVYENEAEDDGDEGHSLKD